MSLWFLFAFLMISNTEHLFMYLLTNQCLLWENIHIFCPFFNWFVWFFAIESYEFFIYFRYQPPIRYMICKYSLPFSRLPFCFVDGFLCHEELFQFDVILHVYFCFCLAFDVKFKIIITKTCDKEVTTYIFFQEFHSLGLMPKSLIHFELVFVQGVKQWYSFILLHAAVQLSQHHLLKKFSFPHHIFLTPLSQIN